MYSVSFDLEIITPLFMAGADGRTPELRPPSFKGMMRFWWRAMKAEKDNETLAEEEASIFGGTGERQKKSKFTIKISSSGDLLINSYSPLPHKQTPFKTPGVKPGQKFKLLIFGDEQYQKVTIAAFKLSVLLGGFGKRSRRGFGSLCYNKFRDIDEIIKEIEEINSTISNHVKLYKKESSDSRTILVRGIDVNSSEYPRVHEIHLSRKGLVSPETILKKIGNASHDNKDNALGTIKPQRMASPIIATVVKVREKFYPVATKLTSHFPPSLKYNINKQDGFINEVLQ